MGYFVQALKIKSILPPCNIIDRNEHWVIYGFVD